MVRKKDTLITRRQQGCNNDNIQYAYCLPVQDVARDLSTLHLDNNGNDDDADSNSNRVIEPVTPLLNN